MKLLLTFIFTLLLNTVFFAQSSINDFVPAGYSIVRTVAEGDLNYDKLNDAILVIGKNGEDSLSTIEHPLKRKLIILFALPNKTYKLVAQSLNQVYYYSYDPNFRDAFVEVHIENNIFYIEH